jgi:CheY-like chemotaxis protein
MIKDKPNLIRVLYVEDSEHDIIMFHHALKKSDISFEINDVSRAEKALEILSTNANSFDVIVSDYKLPGITGLELIRELIKKNVKLPSVLITGAGNENLVVEALKSGVTDYLVKDNQKAYLELLPLVITEAVKRYGDRVLRIKVEKEKEKLIVELHEALANIKVLSGLLPICSSCKKIRDDKGYWNQIESYLEKHSEAKFSHSICPECVEKLYPESYQRMKKKGKI